MKIKWAPLFAGVGFGMILNATTDITGWLWLEAIVGFALLWTATVFEVRRP